ncbi:MAG: protease modulator HflC [Hyphomicrobiaceae bacterium]|nr:protease modulator HflC [Hyphomicrobiaceae bacterium]MCB2053789.1 protease modulator HflC [Geminicoccaceae bacterium]MCC0008280.1 protease modulator HflC [Hyphomicrobiaceae bacterium]
MRSLLATILFLAAAAAGALYLSAFIVHQNEQALVLQFGQFVRKEQTPGLKWKVPVLQQVEFFDKRILDIDTEPQTVTVADKKQLVVDSFARYRITDPLKFYQRLNNEANARQQLGIVLDSSLRLVLGSSSIEAVVRDDRSQLMEQIQQRVNAVANDYGVEIVDVRIMRADLPQKIGDSVYERMKTERHQEAARFRAEGEEQLRRIKAEADRKVTVIRANAMRDAEQLRGEGDAERNRIFADAYGKDSDFFAFYRSMQAYEQGLKSGDTRMVISPDSEFFRYFNSAGGQPAAPAASKGATAQPQP